MCTRGSPDAHSACAPEQRATAKRLVPSRRPLDRVLLRSVLRVPPLPACDEPAGARARSNGARGTARRERHPLIADKADLVVAIAPPRLLERSTDAAHTTRTLSSSASTSTASEPALIPARGRLPHLAVDPEHRSLLISAQIRGAPALVLFLTLSYTSSPSKHARSTTPSLSLPPSSRSVTDFPAPPRLLVLLLALLTSSPPPQALAPWPRTLPRSKRPCASSLDPSRPAQAAPRLARLTSLLVRPPSVPPRPRCRLARPSRPQSPSAGTPSINSLRRVGRSQPLKKILVANRGVSPGSGPPFHRRPASRDGARTRGRRIEGQESGCRTSGRKSTALRGVVAVEEHRVDPSLPPSLAATTCRRSPSACSAPRTSSA